MITLLLLALQSSMNNALVPTSMLSAHAAFKPSALPPVFLSSKMTADGLMGRSNKRVYGSEHIMMMVRGGGDSNEQEEGDGMEDSDEETASEEYDSDTDEESENETINQSSDKSIDDTEAEKQLKFEKLQKQASLSQQSRNFAITTALWSSLFFDVLLNKAKRCDLFPALADASSASSTFNLIPSALLSSGFALASGTAFLLWRDLDIRSEMVSLEEDSDDAEGNKGDWFLSLANSGSNDEESNKFTSQTRMRLYLHLSLFGLLSLAAHAGNYFSAQAPYLGMSASIINVHNTLTCMSALMKEKGLREWFVALASWPLQLFQSGNGEKMEKQEFVSFLFRLSSVIAWVRCIPTCKALIALVTTLTGPASAPTALADNARQLSLQISSLARLTLAAGVTHTIYKSTLDEQFRDHPFFSTLSGIVSTACLGVGGTMLFSSLMQFLNNGAMLSKINMAGGTLLFLFGLVSGFKSVTGFLSFVRER